MERDGHGTGGKFSKMTSFDQNSAHGFTGFSEKKINVIFIVLFVVSSNLFIYFYAEYSEEYINVYIYSIY